MLDRESTFALPGTVQLLQNDFIPVALDQAYQRRQKDTEGDFYRKIASQSPRNDFQNTTQGFYVADASGKLYFYNNNRDPEKVQRLIRKSLEEFNSSPTGKIAELKAETRDKRWNVQPPEGGLVVRVQAKILDGYEETNDRWKRIFQSSVSRQPLDYQRRTRSLGCRDFSRQAAKEDRSISPCGQHARGASNVEFYRHPRPKHRCDRRR